MKQEKIYLKDYKAPAFSVDSVHLDFNLNEDFCRVVAKSQMKQLEAGSALHLNGEDLKLVSVKINGQALSPSQYQLTAEEMIIPTVPAAFTLEIETELEPQNNTYHHRNFHPTLQSIVNNYGNRYIQCHDTHSQHVQPDSSFFERREERRTDLQTDTEHKQDQSKILQKRKDGLISCKSKMSGKNPYE
jgi:hypothetical protein